jgi:hypothetical protein
MRTLMVLPNSMLDFGWNLIGWHLVDVLVNNPELTGLLTLAP